MIKSSPFFNNPQFAQAAANLSSLFAPPSGADAAGWASANAKKEEAARLAQLFDLAQAQDSFDQQQFDRMGVATGQWTPNQSYYGVDKADATDRYGVDVGAATTRRGQDITASTTLQTNALDNKRGAITSLFGALNPGQVRPEVSQDFMDALQLPAVPQAKGAPKPLSETEWKAQQNQRLQDLGTLTDDDLMDAIAGDKTPVQAVGPEGRPMFMSPGAAVREGAQPYDAPSAERVDNYLAVGPNGEGIRFPGTVGPNGQIIDANTGRVVPNIIRKEGTGGGMSFEVDGQGGVRFTTGGAGNTISQQTNLQGQRDAATQSAQELQTLFDNISAADVGVAGNLNDFLTNYGAQIWPDVARGDVTAMRTQLQAATMRLARSLSGDSRISESDRQTAREINAGVGFGESLPGAKAKLAALTVLHAYRAKFAGSLAAGGDPLPPINRSVVGQLVDDGAISAALAQTYVETMLSSSRGGPTQFPGAAPAQQSAPEPSAAPSGVDPADWEYMTPEQRALFR